MGCPSLNELFDHARGALSPSTSAIVTAHLAAGCPHCQENQSWLAEVMRLTAADKSFDFPEALIARVAGWMRPPAAVKQPLRELIAQLVFDSLRSPGFAAARSGPAITDAAGRQMLYRAAGYDIDLRFELTEDGQAEELIGQILPETAETIDFTVRLLREEVETNRAQTDARGIFKFTRIPSGVYDLKIEARGVQIEIPRAGSTRAS